MFDAGLSWRDLSWFRSITKLPIILKGVFTGEDAALAVRSGAVAGLIVSNHGARQLDGVCATIEVLEEVLRGCAGSPLASQVYLDGGVRRGTDIFKAIAVGARAVFVGRPVAYGLAYDGEHGVRAVLSLLAKELSDAMALAGCTSLAHITRNHVMNAPQYPMQHVQPLSKL
jgi:(S)-2-hydroxy-acid oxidase